MKPMEVTGPLPRPGWRALLLDGALAAVLGLICFQAATDDAAWENARPLPPPFTTDVPPPPVAEAVARPGSALGALLLVFVLCAPLVLRRRYPLAVLWATMLASVLVLVTNGDRQPNLYPCVVIASLIAVYSAAAHSPYRWPALVSVAVGVPLALIVIQVPPAYLPFVVLAPLTAAAGGYHVWKRRTGEDRLRAAEEERTREAALREAVTEERARIARELHDVVTHHVTVMVIQTGAARSVLAGQPELARDTLLNVESAGRRALSELRHVMGLLAEPEPDGPADPQPGIEALPALIARVRDAGVPVHFAVRGEERPVSPGIGLTAYRVVQEALTNMVRHAPGADADVLVEYRSAELHVGVSNTSGELPAGDGPVGGRGLVGLQHRVALYGGTLFAASRREGGFQVDALIPLEVE
ncbi:two-component sensor histidine kinase [Actinoplanes bogorensis]|uniref:histidine kinase n=1 Tax=Paractinoplanes bogorensis TaxID=1610840 RepID=A0ABS5YRS3_9ACTN|nr:histidine kinase [Actinoplanes bogorensis]MBU2666053.1 two-component sensor histidine kinase [Actinoplanes bogorensis]